MAEDTTEERIRRVIGALVLAHQMGQWSERRWWHMAPDGESPVTATALLDETRSDVLIDNPPHITTPGWEPTCFVDVVPQLCALGHEYAALDGAPTPEQFRNFLMRERGWLRLQGGARSALELMAEGMNPRIAGLYAPSIVSGCWVAWPAALYHAGHPDDACDHAMELCRTLCGGDIVPATGLLSGTLSVALAGGAGWPQVRAQLLRLVDKRAPALCQAIELSLELGRTCADWDDWLSKVRSPEFLQHIWFFGSGIDWMSSFYVPLSALEFAHAHGASWQDFARGVIAGGDSRYGAMIAFSLRAALFDEPELPEVWLRRAAPVHAGLVQGWAADAAALLGRKLARDREWAREALHMIAGEGGVPFANKVLGVMLAGVAGNVMGSPVEDRDYPWIVERYGVLDHILEPGRLDTEDDSAMAQMWARTYLRCGGRITAEDLADTFRVEMKPHNFYYDSQHAYRLMMAGLPAHACGHWNAVTGSALMGCYPCGVFHAGNPRAAARDGRELAYHYQRGFDVHAAAILCAATAEALRPGATVDTVLAAAMDAAPEEPQVYFGTTDSRDARSHLRAALRAVEGCTDVLAVRSVLYDGFLEYNGQDPWEVVTLTLCIFKVAAGDVWQAMIGGTNIGRDSDTIASQAALLSACLKGLDAVPERVLSLFAEDTLRLYRQMAADMAALVERTARRALDVADALSCP